MIFNLLSAVACIVIFANDMGAAVTREIRNHEYAHCNGWEHPKGYDKTRGYEKAYIPPKKFLRPYHGEVIEVSVSTFEAKARCEGMLGCQRFVD